MTARRRGWKDALAGWPTAAALLAVSAALAQPLPGSIEDAIKPHLDLPEPLAAISAPAADSIQVPSGGRALTFATMKDIPPPLSAAIARADCRIADNLLATHPVSIFRPADGYRVMAVVPCQATVPFSRAFLFERALDTEPTPMTFPVVAPTGGISASSRPGMLSWDPQSGNLIAWRGQNYCPSREMRHIYRQVGGELNGFALTRVEHRPLRCTTPEADWQVLWQSPTWQLQP